MARLNQSAASGPIPRNNKQAQNDEEAIEEDYQCDNKEFSLLLREQLGAEQDIESDTEQSKEDEDVDGAVLELVNSARAPQRTPRTSGETSAQHGNLSVTRRLTGIFSEGIRILSTGTINKPTPAEGNNPIDTRPSELLGDAMKQSAATTSAIKASNRLGRPSVLYKPLEPNTRRSSGKPDVYDIHASPEKAAAESASTRTRSKQGQGVKRKRNERTAAKQPVANAKTLSSKSSLFVSDTEEQEDQPESDASQTTPKPVGLPATKQDTPGRATRSRGAIGMVVPTDFSRRPERGTAKRMPTKNEATEAQPKKDGQRRSNRGDTQGSSNELHSRNKLSTPSKQHHITEEASREEGNVPRRSKRIHFINTLPGTLRESGNKGLRSNAASAASGRSDATESRKKGDNAPIAEVEDPNDRDFEDGGSGGSEVIRGEEELEFLNDEDIDDILLDPSPKKITHSPVITKDTGSKISGTIPSTAADDNPIASDEDTSLPDEPPTTANRSRKRRDEGLAPGDSSHFGNDFIAESNIDKIMEFIEHLGRKDEYLQIDERQLKKSNTQHAKRIRLLTKRILSVYEAIQNLEENDDPDTRTRENLLFAATKDLNSLEVTVRSIIENRLCDPDKLADDDKNKDVSRRKRMLKDVFLNVMPDILRTAAAAIVTFGSEGVPSTTNLYEILHYISLVLELLRIADNPHNKDYRPQGPQNGTYKVLMPYVRIRPLLRGFKKQCKEELQLRERRAQEKRLAVMRERKRKEQAEIAQLEEEEARRKRRKQNAEVAADFDRTRMRLGLPPIGSQMSQTVQWSQPPQPSQPRQTQGLSITEERIRAEREANALALKLKEAENLAKKLRRTEQRLLRGYGIEEEHEADYERVEMFPTDNNHARAVEPWTQTEYEVLAEGLRLESGPYRYENIALRIDRSLDEIFKKANDFKRQMIEYYRERKKPVEPWIVSIGRETILDTGE